LFLKYQGIRNNGIKDNNQLQAFFNKAHEHFCRCVLRIHVSSFVVVDFISYLKRAYSTWNVIKVF